MKKFLYCVLALSLAACAGSKEDAPNLAGTPTTLLVFSAPWCESCEVEVPKIDAYLKTKPQYKGKIFVVTGTLAQQKPDAAALAHYTDYLKVSMAVEADRWRWKTYHQYWPSYTVLPMAVVLNEKGEAMYKIGPRWLSDDVMRILR